MFQFRAKGYKTEKGALKVLADNLTSMGNNTHFVAYQDGKFYPVMIFSRDHAIAIPQVASVGITVLN